MNRKRLTNTEFVRQLMNGNTYHGYWKYQKY